MKGSRMLQLINEAIEEIEKYGSCESAYYILKYLSNSQEDLCKRGEVKYDLTIDHLIFLSMNGKTSQKKYKLYVNAFFTYDVLSPYKVIQDPMFTFRWGKLYFIYSPRIDSHLSSLIKSNFMRVTRSQIKLTERGEEEMENIRASLTKEELRKLSDKLKEIEEMKLTDLKIYTKNYLFAKA
ncbi:hypothetical protein [Stygiolobus caldivivus]|uniref:Uncharacterized protein n=1 Tax=Stygiolobus caldivivus TaxID=2824673 RepID=A0A8D5ZJ39_9CREN|nr:hypothetical protein [Stygiolobus caldivivus]BCU70201.1 hypothetical protein KN1_14980 [Stygiolobus caldivivus]